MQNIAIVVPCYNEEDRLAPDDFLRFVQEEDTVSFIFVDDGSKDGTKQVIEQMCRSAPGRISSVYLTENRGKGWAVRQGFMKAFTANYQAIGYWDADLATPLREIMAFSRQLDAGQVDMVLGSRVRLLNRNIQRNSMRHYLGRFFATFVSLILGLTIYDSQCGAKLFKNSTDLQKVFEPPFVTNWVFDVEILARFMVLRRNAGLSSIAEIACEFPLQEWKDVQGSKVQVKDFFIAVYELMKIATIMKND